MIIINICFYIWYCLTDKFLLNEFNSTINLSINLFICTYMFKISSLAFTARMEVQMNKIITRRATPPYEYMKITRSDHILHAFN